jgi:chromosome segregation ATPase
MNILSLDQQLLDVETKLKQCLDCVAPMKTKLESIRKQYPWFNKEIQDLKILSRRKEAQWRKHHTNELWVDYNGHTLGF